jgi:hypothetical protein
MIYRDHLVSITANEITFAHYYFPTGRPKTVRLADIERIEVVKATVRHGKWRIHGTGNFKTWFPRDIGRPKRDKIFLAKLKRQWVDIGFTVEDAARVEGILREKNLIG